MKLHSVNSCVWVILSLLVVVGCNQSQSAKKTDIPVTTVNYGGFKSQVEWGRHLVLIGGCNDCHTPKKMTAMGPVSDTTMTVKQPDAFQHHGYYPTEYHVRYDSQHKEYVVTLGVLRYE